MSEGASRPGAPAPGKPGERPPEAEESRTLTNIVLVIGFLLLVGGGIWLVDAMLDARRADECMSSGRRDCSRPINPQQLR